MYVAKRPSKPEFFVDSDEDSLANPTIRFFASQYYVPEDDNESRENAVERRDETRSELTAQDIQKHLGADEDEDEDTDMEDTDDQAYESGNSSDDEDEVESSNENSLPHEIVGVETCAISKNVLLVNYEGSEVSAVFDEHDTWVSRLNDSYTCHEYWKGKVMYIESIQSAKKEISNIYEMSGFAKLDSHITDARKAYEYYLTIFDDEPVDTSAVAQKKIYDKYKKDKTGQGNTNLTEFLRYQSQAYDVMYRFIDEEELLLNKSNSKPHEVYHNDVNQALSFKLPPDICDELAASSPKMIERAKLMTIMENHKNDFTLSALINDDTIAHPGAIMTVIKWHAYHMVPPSSLLYYTQYKPAFVDVDALLDRESRSELRISVRNYLSLLPWIKTEEEWDCLIDTKHDETPDPEFVLSTSELTKDKLGTYGQLQVKMLLVMLKRIFGDDKTFALFDIGHGEGEFLSNVREYAEKLGTKITELHGVELNDTYRKYCRERFKSYRLQEEQKPETDLFYDVSQTPSYVKLDYAKVDSVWKIGPLLDLNAVDPVKVCYMYDTYFSVLRYANNHKELLKALCGYADILQMYFKNKSVDAFVTHVPLQQLILFDNSKATPNAVYNVENGVEVVEHMREKGYNIFSLYPIQYADGDTPEEGYEDVEHETITLCAGPSEASAAREVETVGDDEDLQKASEVKPNIALQPENKDEFDIETYYDLCYRTVKAMVAANAYTETVHEQEATRQHEEREKLLREQEATRQHEEREKLLREQEATRQHEEQEKLLREQEATRQHEEREKLLRKQTETQRHDEPLADKADESPNLSPNTAYQILKKKLNCKSLSFGKFKPKKTYLGSNSTNWHC
ncbi:hypothetical protein CYMTET_48270 [Cymbomonas tetramitiformis]|uniref:Uncharacterized protein n=1 Tax=Cymbomonas tetramitiformis TaxID=36881 RepID=A0AAE0EVB5_9CHLO|nr:hypothetical protein CYMTET_48270 [Cymbomonas tetramitiformis]